MGGGLAVNQVVLLELVRFQSNSKITNMIKIIYKILNSVKYKAFILSKLNIWNFLNNRKLNIGKLDIHFLIKNKSFMYLKGISSKIKKFFNFRTNVYFTIFFLVILTIILVFLL